MMAVRMNSPVFVRSSLHRLPPRYWWCFVRLQRLKVDSQRQGTPDNAE